MSAQGTSLYERIKTAAARLVTKPKRHQRRIEEILRSQPGLIAAHGVGTGKTLSSISAAHGLDLPIDAIVPASLQENYKKELSKHIRGKFPARVRSYEKALNEGDVDPKSLLVVDEGHRVRDPHGARARFLKKEGPKAQKRLILTGTPLFNHPHDIASLINIAAGKPVLPEDKSEFENKFLGKIKANPGLFARLRGAQPAEVPYLKEHPELKDALKQWVHYHAEPSDTADFPRRSDVDVTVPMGPEQQQIYNTILKKAPFWVRYKVRRGLPPSKQEAQELNAFLSGTRQVSNAPFGFAQNISKGMLTRSTPKVQAIVHHIRTNLEDNPYHKAIVYSNYKQSGINPVAKKLDEAGIPYRVFSGGMTPKDRKQIIEEFNAGHAPVLLLTSAGSEGLDLKGVRTVHIMEPHFNDEKIEQVIGRARRYKSHAHLPDSHRHVQVRYYQARPKTSLFGRLLGKPATQPGGDEYIQEMAAHKGALNAQMSDLMKSTTRERELAEHPEPPMQVRRHKR